ARQAFWPAPCVAPAAGGRACPSADCRVSPATTCGRAGAALLRAGLRPDARHAAGRRFRRTGRCAFRARAAEGQGAEAAFTCAKRTVERWSRPDLPGAAHAILEAGELLDADRTAGVQLAGGDADLGAEPELAAVSELRRGLVQHDCGIDLV